MSKRHRWPVYVLVSLFPLVSPTTGYAEICGDLIMADVVPADHPEYARASVCGDRNTGRNTCGWQSSQKFFMTPDSLSNPSASPLRIYENGKPLSAPHSTVANVFKLGNGRYSHWGKRSDSRLIFSTSDNTDPRTNGRTYQYGGVCMPTFTVTKVGDTPTHYATFHSNNQKLVQNAYGLFMTYRYNRPSPNNLPGTEGWRLARSTDGGTTWRTIWRGMTLSNAPILETDAHGSIFLVHSDEAKLGGDGNAAFYRFDPEKSFTNPTTNTIAGGSAGKYTSVWDEARQRLYYMTWDTSHSNTVDHNDNFFTLDRAGNILSRFPITCKYVGGSPDSSTPLRPCVTRKPAESQNHYPHLEIDGARLYAAWTTSPSVDVQRATKQRYRAIFYIYSEDGGLTWKAPGTAGSLGLPIVGNEHGPAKMVNLPSELSYPGSNRQYSLWLWNFIAKGDRLHFAYHNELPPRDSRYMRFSPVTGVREIAAATPSGEQIRTAGTSGFFASGSSNVMPLFFASTDTSAQDRLAILKSTNLGASWNDVAVSSILPPSGHHWYAISGNRRITRTGDLIGHVTATNSYDPASATPSLYFFRHRVVNRSNDADAQLVFVALDTTIAAPDGGFAYILPMTGFESGSDTLSNSNYSRLRLFEDGVEIGPAHSLHADIRGSGGGRFSHWTSSKLYFSASDNSDPRTNGRIYKVAFPSTEAQGLVFHGKISPANIGPDQGWCYTTSAQYFPTNGDSQGNPGASGLRLYEDGVPLGPAHASLASVRATGNGAYRHWGNMLYFSASDNSDPRTNGRSYTFAVSDDVTH